MSGLTTPQLFLISMAVGAIAYIVAARSFRSAGVTDRPYEDWSTEQLIDFEISLYDDEVNGEDTWGLREEVIAELNCREDWKARTIMTNEQKRWLDQNPDYEIVGAGGGTENGQLMPPGSRHEGMGALKPDGTFHPLTKPAANEILVGKRKAPPAIPGGGINSGN